MRDTLFSLLGSVRLVQEVSRSASQLATASPNDNVPHSLPSTATTNNSSTATFMPNASRYSPLLNDDSACTHQERSPMMPTPASTTTTHGSNNNDNMMPLTDNINSPWQFPVSLGNYARGVPLFLPSYANPRTLPNWLMPPLRPSTAPAGTTSTTSNTNNNNTRSRRKHVRRNSLYTVRHHHHHHRSSTATSKQQQLISSPQQPQQQVSLSADIPLSLSSSAAGDVGRDDDDDDDKNVPLLNLSTSMAKVKPKSQKLLCLWPLPVITRYIIGISLLVSMLNFMGLLHLKCSSPSYVIHRLEIANLLMSPFLFTASLHAFLLFAWNILILGLFEESLAHMLGGTRQFVKVFAGIVLAVCMTRQAIGYLFSKSTGFAVPALFFSDSLHECSQGLAPFLFALLIVQSLSIDDKYILMYGAEESNHMITVRKFVLQLLMCLVNYTVKNILWWSLTGLLIGYLATIVIQTFLAHQKTTALASTPSWSADPQPKYDGEKDDYSSKEQQYIRMEPLNRRLPLWRSLWSAIKKGAVVVMITIPVLLMCNAYYTRETLVDPAILNQLTHDRYMFTFVVMTAPRRGDPAYLTQTLDSYLANWPIDPVPGSLYDRTQAIVYTHFTNHTQFDTAKQHFSYDPKGQHYVKWIREHGNMFDQRLHVSKALSLAADKYQSTYIALLEDDFPICGETEWRKIETVIQAANQHVPGHCGVFVGTGGSGLFMKPKIAKLVSGLLLKYTETPPDIVMQECLAGNLPECNECSNTLVTSKTLLMYHIGFNTSTSEDRAYKKHDFQCGWRHPFNGDPNVITL
ncbi:hypothetical protein K492DRAFT_161178 [Lichtheimia hyalospora FSU 10163]|nr:hypothetical protein K492DRAFT_161178 [Lichtheimia hyalospora FSU 10163]